MGVNVYHKNQFVIIMSSFLNIKKIHNVYGMINTCISFEIVGKVLDLINNPYLVHVYNER